MRSLKVVVFFALLIACAACNQVVSAAEPKTITLSGAEAKQAQQIADQRQQIAFDRAQAQNDFNTQMNRLAERESILNIESAKLCFSLKKAHSINPSATYWLDEWRGELKKQ